MTAKPSQTVRSVLLAGLSRDVWLVAALLARELPECTALTVVVDETPVPPAGAVVPLASRYHERLGLDLAALVRDCGAIPSLGNVLQGFAGEGHSLVIAASGDLPAIAGASLHQFLLRAQADEGEGADFLPFLAPFRFAARAAEGASSPCRATHRIRRLPCSARKSVSTAIAMLGCCVRNVPRDAK